MSKAEIKTPFATVRLLAPDIVENIIDEYATIDVKEVQELKEINKTLTEGRLYGVLVNPGNLTSITKEAREFLAGEEQAQNTVAKAIMVKSLGIKIVSQFYLTFNKPFVKTKMFTDREEAISWLEQQLKKSFTK
jgi:hypothetical protein